MLTRGADNDNGDIFLAPQGGGPSGGQYDTGPEIVSSTGKLIWFRALLQARTIPARVRSV